MAVTITGGKYSGAITSAGTLTLTNSGASFSSGDFTAQRIVGLWDSAGTTYKGVAWVRARTSDTVLELEKEFIDKDGNTVTQVVGDTYLVSKNYADAAATGLVVSDSQVTITDRIIFGINADTDGVCFYDEGKFIIRDAGGSGADRLTFDFRGGLVVHGHLEDYSTRLFSGTCSIDFKDSSDVGNVAIVTNTEAKVWWLGGFFTRTLGGSARFFPGGSSGGAGILPTYANWQKWWGITLSNVDVASPNNNNWGANAVDQEVADLKIYSSSDNAILQRWGDGTVKGEFLYKLLGSLPLSVSGSNAGTFSFGSQDSISVVRDAGAGSKPGLWRSNSANTITVNYQNLVTSNRKQNQGVSGLANNNATGNHRFYGTYTGLQNGTLSLIKNNSIRGDIEDSGVVSGSSIKLEILRSVVVGHTETTRESSWQFGHYLYGYAPVAGSFSTTNRATASGDAPQVLFGNNDPDTRGFVGQLLDVNITQPTVATVAAYTTIDDLDELYDYAQYFKALNTTNAIYPTVANKLIDFVGGALTTPTAQNITIDTTAGSVFAASGGLITIKPTTALTLGTKGSLRLSASSTLTFVQNGDKSGVVYSIPATGTVLVASGETSLVGSTFASGAAINVSSGTATVTVSIGQSGNITAGSGVTIVESQAAYSADGLADGTQLYLAHVQQFTVSASDVDTGTNTIALGNDSNSQAPAFASGSPYTNVSITATAGATLPATNPQIVDGGRYYATISSGDITLFTKESDISGTPITISAAGTDSGGAVFTLRAETELVNKSVTGGSGASEVLSLSAGDRVIRKAIYWASTAGIATATPLYIQEFLWSTTAGISDPLEVGPSVELDTVHEQIVASTTIQLGGNIRNASGTVVSELAAANDGSTLDTSSAGPYSFALEGGGGKVQVNASDADGLSLWQDLYIWGVWVASTTPGIRLINTNTAVAISSSNFTFANFEIDNTSSTRLSIVGGNAQSADGSSLVAAIQTGSGGVNPNALSLGTLLVFETGTGGLTSGESAILSSLDTRTARVDGLIVDNSGDEFTTKALTNAGGGSAPTVTEIREEIDSNSTQLAAIIADTNELQTDWANGGRLDIILDNVSTFDGNLSGIASQVWSYSGGDRTLSGSQATNLSSILNIPTNPLLTTDSRLDFLDIAISSRSDFEATSDSVIVGDKTGFSLATTPPTALEISQAVWNEDDENRLVTIQAYSSGQAPDELIDLAPTNALITTVDSVVDAIKVKTDQLNFASGDVIATLDGETVNTGLSLSTIESNIGLLLDRLNMTVGKTIVTSPTSINIGSGETVISVSVDEGTNTVTSTRVT
jgi:hypothetical protein